MSYYLRGAVLFLGAFFLIYAALSIAVACGWQALGRRLATQRAAFLYALRVLPLAGAVGVVALLIVPSFLLLEPFRTDETIAAWGGAVACGGIAVIAFGLVSILSAWWKTYRLVASCSRLGRVQLQSGASALTIAASGPVFLVAGVLRPTLMISQHARELLNDGEMKVAIRHELAHVSGRDNLRRLVLHFCSFPLLAGLERRWMQAAELAADDAAATDKGSALDLASALLKMASRPCAAPMPELAMSLLSERDNVLQTRVERLLAWHPAAKRGSHSVFFAAAAVSGIVLLAMNYGPLLGHVHEVTELFVR